MLGTAIATITDEFHSLQDTGWYGSAYLFTVRNEEEDEMN